MPANEAGAGLESPVVPSMLDLVRLSPRRLFPPGGIELFRQIAILTDLAEGQEVLSVACGKGVSLEYFAREFGVVASGVDIDSRMVEEAEAAARELGLAERLQFQTGRSDALPYRDDVFDVTVGEIGIASHCDPGDAVRELVRVTKPDGFVVLLQLVWKAPVDEVRQRILSEHLGARPLMLVEWKRLLASAGVVDVHTEDWSDSETSFGGGVVKPFPDFAELFSFPEKLGVLRRAWSRWGWRGMSAVVAREREVHHLLTRERILGLDLLRGRKGVEATPKGAPDGSEGERPRSTPESARPVPESEESTDRPSAVPASVAALPHPGGDASRRRAEESTEGLPLFGADPADASQGDEG